MSGLSWLEFYPIILSLNHKLLLNYEKSIDYSGGIAAFRGIRFYGVCRPAQGVCVPI